MDDDKVITLPETVLASAFTLSIDGIDVLLWLFGIPYVGLVIDVAVTGIIQFWLAMKGGNYQRALTGNLIEMLPIPITEMLPIRTVALWASIYKTNHPGGDSDEEGEKQDTKVGSPEDYDLAA